MNAGSVLRGRYDPVTGQFLSLDPDVAQTMAGFAYANNDPVNGSDPSGLLTATGDCAEAGGTWINNPSATQAGSLWFGHCRRPTHYTSVFAEAWSWANTPTCLPNPGWLTGPFNAAYGGWKIGNGLFLLIAGTSADLTGVGAVFGIPVDFFGGYQVLSGAARTYRGIKQISAAERTPVERKTPLHFGEDIVLNIAPFGGSLTDWLGGLP